jgi:hypothetical protein
MTTVELERGEKGERERGREGKRSRGERTLHWAWMDTYTYKTQIHYNLP